MKVNNVNPLQYNRIQFGSKATQQSFNQEGYETKVPVSSDTARAYASYGINNNKKNILPVNNLSLEVKGSNELNNNNTALVTILTTHDNPIEEKEGMTDIRQVALYGYINSLSSIGFPSAPLASNEGGSFVGVECKPENINAAIYIAKFLNTKAAFLDEENFEIAKNGLKSYYKENWNKMKTTKEPFMYYGLINEKSIDEVYKKLDNISYNDYLKYCENILKMQNNDIAIDIPQKMLDKNKIDIKDIEKQVFNDISVTGQYKFNVIENDN